MMLRPLGKAGLQVSPLGLGTVKFGRNQGVKYPSSFELPTDTAIQALLDEALTLGINLLDTAPAYGTSETRLGQLLGQTRRDQFCLATKVGEEFENGLSHFDFSARHIRFSVERSLKRLCTDYLDIVLIHSDGDDMNIILQTDAIPTLQKLQQQGLIKAIGMSTKTIDGGIAALREMDIAMVTYNLQETAEKAVIEFAHQTNKGIIIKKALASGHLCQDSVRSPVERSLEHVFAVPGVSSIIVGTLNPAHLRSNVAAANAVLNRL